MRRREYLQAAVGAAGLAGLSTTALAAGTEDVSPATKRGARGSTRPADADISPLGRVDVSNDGDGPFQATEFATTPDGSHAFVSRFDGFEVVDLRDPSSPEIVHTATDLLEDEADQTLMAILDLKYNRDRLLVSAGFPLGFPGFAVYDVSDPADPTLSTYYEAFHAIHNCYLYGPYAYLTAGTSVEIIDLRPEEPEQIGEWAVTDYDDGYGSLPRGLRTAHDLYVQDDRMYVANWDAGTWIVDVSDPSDPTHVGHVGGRSPEELADASEAESREPPGNDHYAEPNDDGSLLLVGAESWNVSNNDEENGADDPGGPSGITIYDIEDPADPSELATIDPPPVPEGEDATRQGYWTTSHNFQVVGDVLYSSWYRGGVKVYDISDPENPEELGAWADGANATFWAARAGVPGDFFVGSSMNQPEGDGPGGLYTFPDPSSTDASITPSGPELTTLTPTDTSPATPTQTETSSATPTNSPTPTDSATATVTQTAEPSDGSMETGTPTATAPPEEDTTTSGDGPGFGPLAALGALGVGAWRFGRNTDE